MIVVTGANGLLGSHILQKLVAEKQAVIALKKPDSNLDLVQNLTGVEWREADILDTEELLMAFEGASTVIHVAGYVSFNPRMREKLFSVNETGTRNVVNACIKKNIKHLIHISSVAALGRQKGVHQINEDSKWDESDLNSDYAESKYRAELEVWRGHEEGLAVAMVNPSIILAPTQIDRSSAKFFQYAMQEKLFYADATINYVDVRDVVEAIWQIFTTKTSGERFIINAGHTSFIDLITQIANRLNKKPPRIKLSQALISLLAILEDWRSRITGSEPLITRQSAKIAKEKFYYSGTRVSQKFNLNMRNLDDTLDWCCDFYLRTYKNNN
ncbi:MAG: NAD-dependent epimerase/dehydratase family protein [Cyclobacteriaceae bacterium]|nr:NAD-dependent epimerase/dehydratase family protein [Cyclobacteriaceae bacterium]